MFRRYNEMGIQNPLLAPETPNSAGGGAPSGPMSKDDVIDFLGEGDEEEPAIELEDDKGEKGKGEKPKGKEKSKEKEEIPKDKEDELETEDDEESADEEDDELADLESELEEPTDEQLELVTPVRRKEILKKYPTLFKDFPYLEKAYYREQQYTELLPTIDDAKEAVSKADTLDKFEKDLMGGNTELMLTAVKNESPKSFNRIVDNYLTTLAKVDEKAYHHVIGNTIKHTIVSMVQEGRKSGNEALASAAQILNQFVFGTSDFQQPVNLSTDKPDVKDERDTKQEQREREFNQRRFNSANEELSTRVTNAFRSTIEANIDPKQSMSDYVRRNASREALENLENLIEKDSRFKILVDKLWERAIEEDFNKSSVDRIRSAFLSKAKTLLKPVIAKARNEALKGMGKRVRSEDKEEEPTIKKGPQKEKPSSQRDKGGKITKASDIPKGMTTLEFLMQED